jgi:hypothetical protein
MKLYWSLVMIHTTPILLLEVCWLAGEKAYYNGQEEQDNPYAAHTREAHFWSEGWWEACLNEGNLGEHLQQPIADNITA